MDSSGSQLADIQATNDVIDIRSCDFLGEDDDFIPLKRLIIGQKLLNILSSEPS